MEDWIDYYDSTHTIYVSKLHRDVHFRIVANDIIRHIPASDAVVLDYSCGEALSSPEVAARCGHLILAEPAPGVRGRLTARLGQNPSITIRSLDELAQQPDRTVDLAMINSVAQYMTPAELDNTFALMRRILKPTGKLVLGDILHPDIGARADVMALLQLAAKNGFLTDALWGLARTALSDYWQLRQSIGLQRYAEAEMIAKLRTAGFTATREPVNVGYNPARMTFVATPCG